MSRWLAVSVFVLSSVLNYLDRALLATLAPLLMAELHFHQQGYGLLISAFSIAYAAVSLITGWFLDRVGVNKGITVAVFWWSAAAACTGFVQSLSGLVFCRSALGIGESAGVPAFGKLNGIYLRPEERALGAAVNQIGLSVGLSLAPLFIGIAQIRGWRLPFILTGCAGFLWIPIWWLVERRIKPQYVPPETTRGRSVLCSRDLGLLVLANVLWMTSYSLWSNWTTLYLMHVHSITLAESAHYTWIPPLLSNAGGFFGGWLSYKLMRRGLPVVVSRRRAVWVSAAGALLTLLLPLAQGPGWSTALISTSFFFGLAGSVNIYALPIDLFGPESAGLGIAALTCAYGIMQSIISPMIGWLGDHSLYTQVVWIATLPMLAAALLLRGLRSEEAFPLPELHR